MLPLHHWCIQLTGKIGIEPTSRALTVRCSAKLSYLPTIDRRPRRMDSPPISCLQKVRPTPDAHSGSVSPHQPLTHRCHGATWSSNLVRHGGFEPPNPEGPDLQSGGFGRSPNDAIGGTSHHSWVTATSVQPISTATVPTVWCPINWSGQKRSNHWPRPWQGRSLANCAIPAKQGWPL